MTVREENELLVDALNILTRSPWEQRKVLLYDATLGEGANVNGYIFKKDTYCWLIWKPTDFDKNPEYKGEPLLKVLPYNVPIDAAGKVLLLQPWTYQ